MVCHTLPFSHDVLVAIDEFVTIRNMPSAVLEKHHDMTCFPDARDLLMWESLGEGVVKLVYENAFIYVVCRLKFYCVLIKEAMSAPPNSPNSMASTRAPSDTNSMSSAQSECDVIVNVMIKKKTKTTIEEAKAKRRARHEIWKQTTTSEERKAIYKKK